MFREEQNTPTLLSDHIPFMAETSQIKLISWNIMKQMKFSDRWKSYNNGFNCDNESDELYTARLSHEAAQLSVAAKKSQPDFICLQECPETLEQYNQFVNAINNDSILAHYHIKHPRNTSCNLITLNNSRTIDFDQGLTEKVDALLLAEGEGLKKQVLPLVFRHKEGSRESILVVNVQADFTKEIKQDVIKLYEHAKTLGLENVMLLGDFNRDLVSKSDTYSKQDLSSSLDDKHLLANSLYVNAVDGGSFCSSFSRNKLKGQWVETRDGTISTDPVTIKSMLETGITNRALAFTKEVSPTLKTMPVDFLTKLQVFNQRNSQANDANIAIVIPSQG
jgi:hypothetical protein